MIQNEIHLIFPSYSENEAFARVVVAAFASQINPTLEELADIKTATSEAVTNAIIHGYEDTVGMVKINSFINSNKIIIEIIDNGKGIENIELARQPLYTSRPDMERSGMGFTVMETFMDKINIESTMYKGTKITMEKIIGGEVSKGEIKDDSTKRRV